ncbi:protein ORF135 [Cyprinid herpesvirus 2]|nr:protein ORF135 [Cyprinid herpesvirus 2]QIM55301.1 hypothetical protein [Cyprinid herpesvirus 2]
MADAEDSDDVFVCCANIKKCVSELPTIKFQKLMLTYRCEMPTHTALMKIGMRTWHGAQYLSTRATPEICADILNDMFRGVHLSVLINSVWHAAVDSGVPLFWPDEDLKKYGALCVYPAGQPTPPDFHKTVLTSCWLRLGWGLIMRAYSADSRAKMFVISHLHADDDEDDDSDDEAREVAAAIAAVAAVEAAGGLDAADNERAADVVAADSDDDEDSDDRPAAAASDSEAEEAEEAEEASEAEEEEDSEAEEAAEEEAEEASEASEAEEEADEPDEGSDASEAEDEDEDEGIDDASDLDADDYGEPVLDQEALDEPAEADLDGGETDEEPEPEPRTRRPHSGCRGLVPVIIEQIFDFKIETDKPTALSRAFSLLIKVNKLNMGYFESVQASDRLWYTGESPHCLLGWDGFRATNLKYQPPVLGDQWNEGIRLVRLGLYTMKRCTAFDAGLTIRDVERRFRSSSDTPWDSGDDFFIPLPPVRGDASRGFYEMGLKTVERGFRHVLDACNVVLR